MPFSFEDVELDVEPLSRRSREAPRDEAPFRIAILGDFSGRANRGLLQPGLSRRPLAIDRDSFNQVLAKLAPELHLPLAGPARPPVRIRFSELDDFHPDRIFERVQLFQALREKRHRLNDRSTFAAAAAEMQSWARKTPQPPPELARMRLDDLFEQSIQETESRSGGPSPGRALDDFSALLRDIVSPHVVPRDDPRQPELIAQVDAAIASRMRACLHHPAFQELEAAWRALFLLVRRLETGGELKLYIIDISKAELDAELKRAGDVRTANTCRLLVEQTVGTPGAEPWSVIAGNYTFEDTSEDVQLLLILANIAWAARAPFLAAASPHIVGCESFGAAPHPDQWQRRDNELWKALRSVPEARWIGLALPRFLLRMPYGKETDPIEYFEFEELENGAAHEDYLWSNPAFACVCLLGQAFGEAGWQMRPGMVRDLDGLPAHVRYQDGEACLKPCAEALMTENAAEILMDTGLMPLLSIKGRDIVRLARFQSIASPPSPLGGRWA